MVDACALGVRALLPDPLGGREAPEPPKEYRLSWPRWAAEESVVKVSEVSEAIEAYGYNRAFWRVWRYLEWLPCIVAVEETNYVKRLNKYSITIQGQVVGFSNYYSVIRYVYK